MQDEIQQQVDKLLLELLAEEGWLRECALLAAIWAEDGHEHGAEAMRAMGERHAAEVEGPRGKLATLQSRFGGGSGQQATEQVTMNLDAFRERLATLSLGETATLTRAQFEQVFAEAADLTGQRAAAVALAETMSCRLLFRQAEAPYAVFTRRQRLLEVRASWENRAA